MRKRTKTSTSGEPRAGICLIEQPTGQPQVYWPASFQGQTESLNPSFLLSERHQLQKLYYLKVPQVCLTLTGHMVTPPKKGRQFDFKGLYMLQVCWTTFHVSFLNNLLKIKTYFAPSLPPAFQTLFCFFFSCIGRVSWYLQEPPSVMFLCLSAEPKVKTGEQQVSWKGQSLAVS